MGKMKKREFTKLPRQDQGKKVKSQTTPGFGGKTGNGLQGRGRGHRKNSVLNGHDAGQGK